jgi:hypothetical protein
MHARPKESIRNTTEPLARYLVEEAWRLAGIFLFLLLLFTLILTGS